MKNNPTIAARRPPKDTCPIDVLSVGSRPTLLALAASEF
jgi:hypothetical protein